MPVIIPDVNLLIYAFDQESRFHAQAKPWLENALWARNQWVCLGCVARLRADRYAQFARASDA